jgi:prepilin-type N-terminal cleavage/methylation domain-containing protein
MGKLLKKYNVLKSSAFTLTELLVVMAVIVIVLGVGVGGLREMRSLALTQMGAAEMRMAAKATYKSAVQGKVPTALTLLTKGTGAAQGYLMGGSASLFSYCGFNKDVITGASGNAKGLGNERFLGNNVSLVPGAVSYGLDLGALGGDVSSSKSINVSGNVAVYIEGMVKAISSGGANDLLKLGTGARLMVDADEMLFARVGSGNTVNSYDDFPVAAERIFIGGNDWKTIGLLVATNPAKNELNAYLFLDGEMVGSIVTIYQSGDSDYVNKSLVIKNSGATGYIDEVRAYNLGISDPVMNDLKAGFYASGNLTTNYLSQTILLDGQGRLISTRGTKEEYICFASLAVSGKIEINASDSATGLISGSKASAMPDTGHILITATSGDTTYYELNEYKDFNGSSLLIQNRNIGSNNNNLNGTYTFYYAQPIIFNTLGGVQ